MNIFGTLLNSLFIETGGGTGPGTTDYCANVKYATRKNIELIFGTENVAKWADVDGSGDVNDITDRICWSLQQAETQINSRLLGGPYEIPFAIPCDISVTDNTARLAGVLLYEARGVPDTGGAIGSGRTKAYSFPKHQLTYHRKLVESWINDILCMKIELVGLLTSASTPMVGTDIL